MADVKFDKAVFAVEVPNHELLKVAYESYLGEKRQVGAKTLTRGLVRGGGKKPWRQKGTGRARFGSSRNPIWRTGGIVFGPTGNENYTKKLSQTSKHVALRQALTLANQAKKVVVIDEPKLTGKTKEAVKILKDLKIDEKNRVLAVVVEKTEVALRATNNLPNVKLVKSKYLTVFDILNADTIVFGPNSLKETTDWLTTNPKGDK